VEDSRIQVDEEHCAMICGEALWRDGNPSYPLPLAWQHENPNIRALNVSPAGPFSPKAGPPPAIPKLVAIVTRTEMVPLLLRLSLTVPYGPGEPDN
jgi:hypothetical protein